jgi:sugar O-acyltransferase (sialic acid O-acetyltransferase NeuD family)
MANVYIFGAGGHARVIASFLKATPIFVVDSPSDPTIMSVTDYFNLLPKGDAYIGIGTNSARQRISERLRAAKIRTPACIAPTAFVARDATIGDGAVICAGAVVGSKANIGCYTIVNTLSSVDHDCTLGDLSQVTAGVTFGGTVTVGVNCFFGIKSAVIPNKEIGDNVQVMAGSLIVSNVPPNVMMGGNPARIVRKL